MLEMMSSPGSGIVATPSLPPKLMSIAPSASSPTTPRSQLGAAPGFSIGYPTAMR